MIRSAFETKKSIFIPFIMFISICIVNIKKGIAQKSNGIILSLGSKGSMEFTNKGSHGFPKPENHEIEDFRILIHQIWIRPVLKCPVNAFSIKMI